MIEKDDLVLTPSGDHSYRKADVYFTTVTFNKKYKIYSEDVGISPLSEDEEIVSAWVIE